MKKKLTSILALFFAALFLCGAALPNGWYREDGTEETLRFTVDWVDISHLFEQPFYVISYPVSACCALEIYERELDHSGAGVESFLRMAESAEIGIVSAAAEAGLQNPITDRRVQEVTEFLSNVLSR